MAQESSEVFTYDIYGISIGGYKSSGKAIAKGSVIEINHDLTVYAVDRKPKIKDTTLEPVWNITVKYIIDTVNKKVAIELPLCMLDTATYRDDLREIHRRFQEALLKVCKCLTGISDSVKDDGNVRYCYEKGDKSYTTLTGSIILPDYSKLIKPSEVRISNREVTESLCQLIATSQNCYPLVLSIMSSLRR